MIRPFQLNAWLRIIARHESFVLRKTSFGTTATSNICHIDERMSGLIPAWQPAAERDCMLAIVNNVVQEESPERSPNRSKRRPSAQMEINEDQSENTSHIGFIHNAAGVLEDADNMEIDSRERCSICRELHLPGTVHSPCGKLMPNIPQ